MALFIPFTLQKKDLFGPKLYFCLILFDKIQLNENRIH